MALALAQVPDAPVDTERLTAARARVITLRLADRFDAQFAEPVDDTKIIDDCFRKNTDATTPEAAREDCIAKAERFRATFEPLRQKRLPSARAQLLEAAAATYARLLSIGDLKALADFYATPVGQRTAAIGPALDHAFAESALDINLQLMIDVLGDASQEQRK